MRANLVEPRKLMNNALANLVKPRNFMNTARANLVEPRKLMGNACANLVKPRKSASEFRSLRNRDTWFYQIIWSKNEILSKMYV